MVDLPEALATMLREFDGGRTSGLVFCKPDGSQLTGRTTDRERACQLYFKISRCIPCTHSRGL